MIYYYDDFEFMFLVHRNLDKAAFLFSAGANHGYAADMFGRMYDALMIESLDVIEEFNRFYKPEYEALGGFLYRKWNFSYKNVEDILKKLEKNPEARLMRRIEYSYYGSELRKFMSEEPMVDRIEKILLMK
ncbi:hypothetical protein BDE36_2379 [Arcticibacter tournemirensis]|uniref:Uncharacterized protein n=1 Tax=Arcticibacter tournemirensis TaxID=699437 RepID=A0A5M9H1Z6_9SPHI|nr:hypothetical protein [Arcticibacter tournemirensis]KAA8480031.1 hypothetical protein F1649_15495 [Arcticibacter tournemirensis]TQM50632.1 hypothetical protein BDE36_2379 [Arcticibacter tournemirensis]